MQGEYTVGILAAIQAEQGWGKKSHREQEEPNACLEWRANITGRERKETIETQRTSRGRWKERAMAWGEKEGKRNGIKGTEGKEKQIFSDSYFLRDSFSLTFLWVQNAYELQSVFCVTNLTRTTLSLNIICMPVILPLWTNKRLSLEICVFVTLDGDSWWGRSLRSEEERCGGG